MSDLEGIDTLDEEAASLKVQLQAEGLYEEGMSYAQMQELMQVIDNSKCTAHEEMTSRSNSMIRKSDNEDNEPQTFYTAPCNFEIVPIPRKSYADTLNSSKRNSKSPVISSSPNLFEVDDCNSQPASDVDDAPNGRQQNNSEDSEIAEEVQKLTVQQKLEKEKDALDAHLRHICQNPSPEADSSESRSFLLDDEANDESQRSNEQKATSKRQYFLDKFHDESVMNDPALLAEAKRELDEWLEQVSQQCYEAQESPQSSNSTRTIEWASPIKVRFVSMEDHERDEERRSSLESTYCRGNKRKSLFTLFHNQEEKPDSEEELSLFSPKKKCKENNSFKSTAPRPQSVQDAAENGSNSSEELDVVFDNSEHQPLRGRQQRSSNGGEGSSKQPMELSAETKRKMQPNILQKTTGPRKKKAQRDAKQPTLKLDRAAAVGENSKDSPSERAPSTRRNVPRKFYGEDIEDNSEDDFEPQKPVAKVACPMCLKEYPKDTIQRHAARCNPKQQLTDDEEIEEVF